MGACNTFPPCREEEEKAEEEDAITMYLYDHLKSTADQCVA